jgi:hypothetical protein
LTARQTRLDAIVNHLADTARHKYIDLYIAISSIMARGSRSA